MYRARTWSAHINKSNFEQRPLLGLRPDHSPSVMSSAYAFGIARCHIARTSHMYFCVHSCHPDDIKLYKHWVTCTFINIGHAERVSRLMRFLKQAQPAVAGIHEWMNEWNNWGRTSVALGPLIQTVPFLPPPSSLLEQSHSHQNSPTPAAKRKWRTEHHATKTSTNKCTHGLICLILI